MTGLDKNFRLTSESWKTSGASEVEFEPRSTFNSAASNAFEPWGLPVGLESNCWVRKVLGHTRGMHLMRFFFSSRLRVF